jgi:hypothetical protein
MYLDFVDNTVKVYPLTKRARIVYVSIPSGLFSWLSAVLTKEEMTQAKKKHMQFFLEETRSGWTFGMEVKNTPAIALYMWSYPESKFPAWAVPLSEATA